MLRGIAPHSPVRRTVVRAAAVAVALAAASLLVGCAMLAPEPGATPPATSTPDSMSPSGESFGATITLTITPAEVCAQLIDINTLVYNERMAFDEGRIAEVEYQSVNRLAGRMVHRVDVSGATDLDAAVDALRDVVGPYKPGAVTDVDPSSDEWTSAMSDAEDECTREGVQFYVEGWTGG